MKKNNIAAEDENNAQDDPLCVDMNEIFFKLKTIDVSKTELAEIKIMLKSTFQYRQNMIKNNENLDLLENFPYFFTNPELVNISIDLQMVLHISNRFYFFRSSLTLPSTTQIKIRMLSLILGLLSGKS